MDGYMPGMDHNHHRTTPATPEQLHRARVAVCARATDPDDARHLLALLGLLPQPEPEPAPPPEPDNRRRGPWLDQYGRLKKCRNGHQWTTANTRWRRNSKTPQCRAPAITNDAGGRTHDRRLPAPTRRPHRRRHLEALPALPRRMHPHPLRPLPLPGTAVTCRPLVVRHPDGTWQAWCPQHRGWDG